MGGIVSMHSNGTFNEFQIIVGQQRLTTISPLLLATYHLMKSGVVVPQQENLPDMIYETYLINKWQKNSRRIRLKTVKKINRPLRCFSTGRINTSQPPN